MYGIIFFLIAVKKAHDFARDQYQVRKSKKNKRFGWAYLHKYIFFFKPTSLSQITISLFVYRRNKRAKIISASSSLYNSLWIYADSDAISRTVSGEAWASVRVERSRIGTFDYFAPLSSWKPVPMTSVRHPPRSPPDDRRTLVQKHM